jgi:hypothetical protein
MLFSCYLVPAHKSVILFPLCLSAPHMAMKFFIMELARFSNCIIFSSNPSYLFFYFRTGEENIYAAGWQWSDD